MGAGEALEEGEVMAHGRRMSTAMYTAAYTLCKYRDGEKCAHCGWTYGMESTAFQKQHKLNEKLQRIELDHIDGNPCNNPPDGSNWRLLCRTCNLWWGVESVREGERGKVRKGERVVGSVDEDESEVERMERVSMTEIAKKQIDNRGGEPTQQANAIYEPRFRLFVRTEIDQKKQILWNDLIDAGSESAGCGQTAATRYLRKMTSYTGDYEVVVDTEGNRWVKRREVEEKPKRGRPRKK